MRAHYVLELREKTGFFYVPPLTKGQKDAYKNQECSIILLNSFNNFLKKIKLNVSKEVFTDIYI